MSPVDSFSFIDHNNNSLHYSQRPTSAKRKLDDYAPSLDSEDEDAALADLVPVRMRKEAAAAAANNAVELQLPQTGEVLSARGESDGSRPSLTESSSSSSRTVAVATSLPRVQFFIRMMSEGKTMVIQANANDSVKSIHERIQVMTGIPVIEQRLIYRGKQLQWEQSLADCAIQNDAGLQLVGRMRSTEHPQAWQLIDNMVCVICRLCRGEHVHSPAKLIKDLISEFLSMRAKDDNRNGSGVGHLQIFMSSSAPAALVMLYISAKEGNKECAESSIKHFLKVSKTDNILSKSLHSQCAPIVLEFCKLLRKFAPEDNLYSMCRSSLASLLESIGHSRVKYEEIKGLVVMQDIVPFVKELALKLSTDLNVSMSLGMNVGPLESNVRDFTVFLLPLRKAILDQVGYMCPIPVPFAKTGYNNIPVFLEEIEYLHALLSNMLILMDKCLSKVEDCLRNSRDNTLNCSAWSQYLIILKELYNIAQLYQGAEEHFWSILRIRKSAMCALIVRYAKRSDDNLWLLEHMDVTNFESRRLLVMMMFPDVREDYEELHEMLIDRSQLLAESFEYIVRAERESLHSGLFMEFKNEEATGPGVLREWFFLVCQAIFNPQNALFVACPNDRRRFYPNPASKVDPLHLEYFTFAGRVIALALMHRVQVGVVLDRVFFLQLSGRDISLEDIRDADPCLYTSCKQILEMDTEFIDSDALGLTFVREVDELGSRKVVELCSNGKSIVVNSKNREEYVNLLIRHRFVTSISEQISHFAQGFADILDNTMLKKLFFQSLELEDLDLMLFGSESAISIEDWKAHTDYNGYKENDPQILWFWKVVERLSPEQRRTLLFFWTSVKHLPVEGFCGLASRLYIYKTTESTDRLPSSHTCFYRLCFPVYPTLKVMRDRFRIVTQEHVGCSFGTW
ncbi:hypothetical protein Q3G72_033228 [Acer saccharum]|nr:hypothetical protein Q3G72_033228 [Acer saccharum]